MAPVSMPPHERARKSFQGALHGLDAACIRRTFHSWMSMLDRCMVPGHIAAGVYFDRGIVVCERWFTFANFVKDVGPRPEGKTLDRIDVNGIYEPGNCRWATPQEQASNTRRTKKVGGMTQAQAARLAGVHESTIMRRIARGMSPEEAIHGKHPAVAR